MRTALSASAASKTKQNFKLSAPLQHWRAVLWLRDDFPNQVCESVQPVVGAAQLHNWRTPLVFVAADFIAPLPPSLHHRSLSRPVLGSQFFLCVEASTVAHVCHAMSHGVLNSRACSRRFASSVHVSKVNSTWLPFACDTQWSHADAFG